MGRRQKRVFKMAVLGGPCTGKTALVGRLAAGASASSTLDPAANSECYIPLEAEQRYKASLGADFVARTMTGLPLEDGTTEDVVLQVWDVFGGACINETSLVGPAFYRGAEVILLCYDVTNRDSFFEAVQFYNTVLPLVSDAWFFGFVLVGLKAEPDGAPPVTVHLTKVHESRSERWWNNGRRQIPRHWGEAVARSMKAPFFEVSSKYSSPNDIDGIFKACIQVSREEGCLTLSPIPPQVWHVGRVSTGSVRIPCPSSTPLRATTSTKLSSPSLMPDNIGHPQPLTAQMQLVAKTLVDHKQKKKPRGTTASSNPSSPDATCFGQRVFDRNPPQDMEIPICK